MFGFGKKEQKRIDPVFGSEQASGQVAQFTDREKKLADILGAEENDTNITAGVDAILDEETSLNNVHGEISGAEIDFSALNQEAEAEIAAQNQQSMDDDVMSATDFDSQQTFNTEQTDSAVEPEAFAVPKELTKEKTGTVDVLDVVADSEQVLELETEDIVEEPPVFSKYTQEKGVSNVVDSQNLDDNLDKLLEISKGEAEESVTHQSGFTAEVPFVEETVSEPKQEVISQESLPVIDGVSSTDSEVDSGAVELSDFLAYQNKEISQDYTVEDILDNKIVINRNEIVETNAIKNVNSDSFALEEKESSQFVSESQSNEDKAVYESVVDDVMEKVNSVELNVSDAVAESVVADGFTLEPKIEPEALQEEIESVVESSLEKEFTVSSAIEQNPIFEPEPILDAEAGIVCDANVEAQPVAEHGIAAEPEFIVSESNLEPAIVSDDVSESDSVSGSVRVVEDFMLEPEKESKVEDVWVESPIVAEPIASFSSEVLSSNDLWQAETASVSLVNPKILNRSTGLSTWEASDSQKDFLVELDSIGEASAWRIVLFNKVVMPLKNVGSDISLEQKSGVIRFASLMQSGKEQLQMFNQSEYHFVVPQNGAVSVQSNSICTAIDETMQLNVDDFVVISGTEVVQKTLRFVKPMSGFVSGPDGVLVFFAKAHSGTITVADYQEDERIVEYEPSLKGLDIRTDFVYDESQSEGGFTAHGVQRNLVVNVGRSLYGWNIRFDNEMFMSLRDALEYQSRYKKLPSANGEIIHGRKVFKFLGIEKLQAREKTVYYSYGNIR